eukprot:2492139-Lingulodinium_polyedra.AAC.1
MIRVALPWAKHAVSQGLEQPMGHCASQPGQCMVPALPWCAKCAECKLSQTLPEGAVKHSLGHPASPSQEPSAQHLQ